MPLSNGESSALEDKHGSSPFFSVIIPVYNKEPYLNRALCSVASQTFSDYEVLAVCDPSTDNSLAVVESFPDARIRVIRRAEPGAGGYAARNLGIKEAQGVWLAFLDADDQWLPQHLEALRSLIDLHGDCALLGCGWEKDDGASIAPDRYWKENVHKGLHVLDLKKYFSCSINGARPVHTSVACVKKASVGRTGLFPENSGATRGGDLDAWLSLVCQYKRMAWSPHVGAKYFANIVGQVTKNATPNLSLYSQAHLDQYRVGLDQGERRLFNKYMNRRLFKVLLVNKKLGNPIPGVLKYINWRGDWMNGLKNLFLAKVVPTKVIVYFSGGVRK
jgi:glycosyltransferase involved in cell wall biosynthesis